jgi:diadenosine tetraphosphatase ApaH/serine/threonine PP2A family protein phosphatase
MHDTIDRKELLNLTSQVLLCQSHRRSVITDFFPPSLFSRLFTSAASFFRSLPQVLTVDSPLVIVGDIHGNLDDLIRIFQRYRYPPSTHYLFLGDYIDRGAHSIEVLALLLALVLLHPDHMHLLRGNHETRPITMEYGFREMVSKKLGADVYESAGECFEAMPVCGIVNREIFCVHGGIPGGMGRIVGRVPEEAVMDLLWADPRGAGRKRRGSRRGFSREELNEFLKENGLRMMIRAHKFASRGFCWNFGEEGKCLTVFSSSGYQGKGNMGAVAIVGAEGEVRTEIMSPMTNSQFVQRRILIPNWALVEGEELLQPVLIPDVCRSLVH